MGADPDRADTRTASTMRDAERLVQVQMTDVGPERPRAGDADEGVEVGSVDVHLAAGLVHRPAQTR